MYQYLVRLGYGSDKLIVEFMNDSTEEAFVTALRAVLSSNDVSSIQKNDFIFLHQSVMESPAGIFEIEHDEWCMIWVHADDNQDAIHFMDSILTASGKFQKDTVDFTKYAQLAAP
jgi:hypothetical protein